MAPVLKNSWVPRHLNFQATSTAFADEWSQPSNYAFTILLLLGGDVVSRALAQLAGGWITPVAFSFGRRMYFLAPTLHSGSEHHSLNDP